MNLRKVLVMVLCLMLVLSCVPAMNVIPEAQAAEHTVRIEAENAAWNIYHYEETTDAAASGGVWLGSAKGTPVYASWDDVDSTEDLANGFIDKSNDPYAVFYVDAPKTDTYKLNTASKFRLNADCDNAYAAILVNPAMKIQDSSATVSYQAHYGAASGSAACYKVTETVEVQLVEGRNVIFVVPLTAEQNVRWATVDYLDITGDYPVEHIASGEVTLYAGNAPYVAGYTTKNADGSIGDGNWGSYYQTAIADMNLSNAANLRGFTYTVNAPEDGYYDITAEFDSCASGADTYALGFLVDGKSVPREFAVMNSNSAAESANDATLGHKVDFSVYLTKGDHVLTFTAPAKKTAADTDPTQNVVWFNYNQLYLYGGLTKSVIQSNPSMDWWYAEAEYQDQGYAVWHGFNATDDKRANTFRDYNNANYAAYQVKCGIGGGNAANNYSLAQLREGRLDKATTTGVTIYVEAPEAGSYDFYAYYYLKCPGIWDSANKVLTETPYSVFMVNGEFGAKANFLASGYDWSYNTETVQLQLEKGLNEITFIPQTADQYKSENDWAVVDCIFVDTALQVAKVPTDSVTVKPGKGISYLYTNNVTTLDEDAAASFTYGNFDIANNENLSASTITRADLYKLCFVAYTVVAPYDGYYDISMVYGSSGSNTKADYAFALLVDDRAAEVKHLANDGAGTVDISTYLTKGTHTLTITNILPIDAERAESKDMYWTNMDAVTFYGGLTLAETQVNPLTEGMTVLEAEEYANYQFEKTNEKKYQNTSEVWFASGGAVVGGSDASILTTDQVKEHVSTDGQPFVEYIVEAPAAGSYEIKLGVRPAFASGADKIIYVQVNGTIVEVLFNANNGSKYASFCLPVTVTLAKGRNVIRVLSPTATQTSSSWIDQDYLAIPNTLTAHQEKTRNLVQADSADYIGNYNYVTNDSRYWDSNALNNSVVADLTLSELTEATFRKASWYSLTVEAPADGYYPMQAKYWLPSTETTGLMQLGLLVNGEAFAMNAWQNTSREAYGESIVYLEKGKNDLIFVGILSDSNVQPDGNDIQWLDADFVRLCGGLTLAKTQRYPVEGLVDGSVYDLSGSKLSDVWHKTTVGELKSNFFGSVTVTSGGSKLADTDIVPNGAVVSYDTSDTKYTVSTYNRGDADGNDVIDIRDLKVANEQSVRGVITDLISDIVKDLKVDNQDVLEYIAIIFGKTDSDLFYQPHSIGADEILALCNPVGRLLNYRSAVFMESSASGFTLTGDLKGNVTISLRAEEGTSSGGTACIYVEVDGVVSEHAFTVNTDQEITIATDLTAGDHTVKVTKGTDAKYDSIYVYSVSYHGTLKEAEPAAHSIEFLGDSITVGFGLYDESSTMSGSYYSYANVAADLLGADHYTIGNGAWRFGENTGAEGDNRYLGYIYEKNSMNLDLGAYDFAWQPEVIVINLGTNDANQYTLVDNGGEQDQAVFTADMAALLNMVRTHNPNAKIFWIYGAMEDVTAINKSIILPLITNAIDTYNSGKTEAMQVTYIHVDNASDGVGDHPTRAQQATMGQTVAAYIDDAMGWDLVD